MSLLFAAWQASYAEDTLAFAMRLRFHLVIASTRHVNSRLMTGCDGCSVPLDIGLERSVSNEDPKD